MTFSPDITGTTTHPDPATAPWMVLELAPDQVAQHPDNLRDPRRGIKELTASVAELGVLVPLIVVPVGAVPLHEFNSQVTHVAGDDVTEVRITYGCTDPEQYRHLSRYGDRARPHQPTTGPIPEGEDEQARAEREARQAQEKRDARRQLIQRNKDADAATQVRQAFLQECLTVKSRHKAMTAWAMLQVLQRNRSFARWIGEWSSPPVLGDILGCDPGDAITTATTSPAVRHPIMIWAYLAAAHEAEFPRDAHRQASTDRAGYLRHLAALGYVLADVEQLVIDNAKTNNTETDDAHDEGLPADNTAEEVTPINSV